MCSGKLLRSHSYGSTSHCFGGVSHRAEACVQLPPLVVCWGQRRRCLRFSHAELKSSRTVLQSSLSYSYCEATWGEATHLYFFLGRVYRGWYLVVFRGEKGLRNQPHRHDAGPEDRTLSLQRSANTGEPPSAQPGRCGASSAAGRRRGSGRQVSSSKKCDPSAKELSGDLLIVT